ncbi:MAG TPA: hypothetical protein PKU97_14780 [Kofleriaceae bacterium]|nr:hypothetical protein [Kofleriaceae bacterium]
MSADQITSRVESALPSRPSLVTVPTALEVDPSREVQLPEVVSFERWTADEHTAPARAVAFLQFLGRRVLATVIDTNRGAMAARIWMNELELGSFCAAFMAPRDHDTRRTISLAPEWFGKQSHPCDQNTQDTQVQLLLGGPNNEKPPDPPKVQLLALVTLGAETSAALEFKSKDVA